MDWQSLVRNKWAWVGVAGAAGLGAFALYRRKKTGAAGGGTAGTGAQATPAYAGGVGGFDSTGTDVAAWLGNYSGNLQHQLDAYQQQLTDTLGQIPPGATGTGSGGTGGASAFAFAAPNQNLYELGDLNQLRQLNPSLNDLILWADPTPQHPFLTPHLQTGMNLRVS